MEIFVNFFQAIFPEVIVISDGKNAFVEVQEDHQGKAVERTVERIASFLELGFRLCAEGWKVPTICRAYRQPDVRTPSLNLVESIT